MADESSLALILPSLLVVGGFPSESKKHEEVKGTKVLRVLGAKDRRGVVLVCDLAPSFRREIYSKYWIVDNCGCCLGGDRVPGGGSDWRMPLVGCGSRALAADQ